LGLVGVHFVKPALLLNLPLHLLDLLLLALALLKVSDVLILINTIDFAGHENALGVCYAC
jgi:hypothetical protein